MEQNVKRILLELGADVCGIAHINSFESAPENFSPIDLFPQCKSVIVFGMALPKGLTLVEPRLLYGHFNEFSSGIVDRITFLGAKAIEKEFDCSVVPVPCDSPYESWDKDNKHGRGLISVKHAAVLAGLGTLGKNTLLLNPQFGNLLTIGALLTDLCLASDELCEDICISGCTKCLDTCPVHAITNGNVNQKLCRENTYGKTARGFGTVDCNKCRMICPMKYGSYQRVSR